MIIFRAFVSNTSKITIINHPLPYIKSTISNLAVTKEANIIILAQCAGICIFFAVVFVLKERVCNFKVLQYVGGIDIITFWMVHIIWDLLIFFIIALVVVVVISCFQLFGFSTFTELGNYKFYCIYVFFITALKLY